MQARVIPTGHGRPALERLREVVAEAKRDDPMAAVTVLVPDELTGLTVRRYLAGLRRPGSAATGVAGLGVTTLPRLAEALAGPQLSPRRPQTRAVLATAWREVLGQAPGRFARVADHPATIRALVRAHRDLRELTPAGLAAVAASGATGADLVALHERVWAVLAPGWYDRTDLLVQARDRVHRERADGLRLGTVVLHLPQEQPASGTALLAELARRSGLVVVQGLVGDDAADAAVRDLVDQLRHGLRRLVPNRREEAAADPEPRTADEVLHASDADDEVRAVVRRVVTALTQTPADRIAVLHPGGPYPRLLHEHLAAAGLTVNGPGVRPVAERALARGFLALLGLAEGDVPRADLFTALAHAPIRTPAGDPIPISRWERASREAGVVRGRDWSERLQAAVAHREGLGRHERTRPEGDPVRAERVLAEIDTFRELQHFVTSLRARLRSGAALHTWAEVSAWALRLLHDHYGTSDALSHLPSEEQYAAAAIEQSLTAVGTLDALGSDANRPTADLVALREVLDLDLAAASPRVGRFGEGVFVGPVASATGLDADLVFVVGLAEDAYPGRTAPDPLLPDDVRAATGELPDAAARPALQHRRLLAAFGSAHVVASFPRGDLRRSTTRRPSRWLVPSLAGAQAGESRSFWDEVRRTPQPASEAEWRIRAASLGRLPHDPVVAAAGNLLDARASDAFTRFDGNLDGAGGLPDHAQDGSTISPTSLEDYARCPHAWFVGRLLGVRPLEQPEDLVTVDPRDSGAIIHRCMDRLIREAGDDRPVYGQPWPAAARDRLLRLADEECDAFERTGATGHRLLWEYERDLIRADLAALLDDDDAYRAERDAAVLASELSFGARNAVVVEVPGGGAVRLVGSADRVDLTRDGVLLVADLKTGRPQRYRTVLEDPVAGGTRLQLPGYALAARAAFGEPDTPVEAMYWFTRRRGGGDRIPIAVDDAVLARFAATVGVLVGGIAAGRFPAKAPDTVGWAGHVECGWCDPDGLGHADARRRYERKRHDPALADLVGLIDPPGSP